MKKNLGLKINTNVDKLIKDVENIDVTGLNIKNENLIKKDELNNINLNQNNSKEFKDKIYKVNDSKTLKNIIKFYVYLSNQIYYILSDN